MHFEILIEDLSGKKLLDLLVHRLISSEHTVAIHPYKGIGRIPKGLKPGTDASKRILLDQLPRLLQGFGNTFLGYGENYPACVIVIVDLDRHQQKVFTEELQAVAKACSPAPATYFCLAIEEGEAWLLGDIHAVLAAYPHAKRSVLENYQPDSICGTWELLADAVYPGGAAALTSKGWQTAGAEKSIWAVTITPHLDLDRNRSPSFQFFRQTMQRVSADGSRLEGRS